MNTGLDMALNVPKNPKIAFAFLKRKFSERKSLAVALVCWIVAVILVFAFMIPQARLSLAASQSLAGKRQQLAILQDKLTGVQTFQTGSSNQQQQKVNMILPSSKPLLQLLNSLSRLSQDQQVSLTGVELNPGSLATGSAVVGGASAETENSISMLKVKLKISGDLAHINAYLGALNNVTPILEITSISLTPKSGAQQTSQTNPFYDGDIEVQSYYAPINAKAVLTQKLPSLTADELEFVKRLDTFIVFPSTTVPNVLLNKIDLFAY